MLSAAACSSDDGGGTVEPTPTIGVSVAPPTVTVAAGQNGTAAVTVTRGGGYAGAVNLSVEGSIPAGSATPNPAALAAGVTASTINITTASATPAGTYNLTVRATGTGAVVAVTTPLTVTVTAPPPPPGFTIAPAAALTVTQGAAATNATINITRTGNFAGAVTLTTGTVPAGLTVTPSAATTGNSATVAVSAATTIAPGTYPITINATGAGVTGTQTTTLNVTVAAAQATPDFTIAPAAVSVQAGAPTPGTSTVTITRAGGFAGAVTLTTSGAPAGLTITPPAATTGNTADLSITAAGTLAPGTYPITVSATGAGVTGTKTATLNVTVTPAVQVGGYTLGTTGAVSVQQGATGTTTLNVTRTGGFAGGVTITHTGAPSGVQVTVTPNPVTGNTATVTVTASGSATTGNATITLTGAATGIANQTTTLAVNVTPASTGGGNVSYTFCAPDIPIWFAFQNDNGAWTRVTAGANNTFAFNVPARGGIAYVTQTGTTYDLTVVYGTAAELVAGGQQRCASLPRGTKRLTGSVAGVGMMDFASVSLGSSSELLFGGTTAFTLDSVPDGALNLLASRSSLDPVTFSLTPSRLILRRGVNYANNAVIPTLDFNGSEAFAPATANLTVNGAGTDTVFVSTAFTTGAFDLSGFGTGGFFVNFGSSPLRYAGVPTDRLQTGDLHALVTFANVRGDSTSSRGIFTFVRTITDRSVTLGPSPSAATVTAITSTPYLRLRATAASQAAYNAGASVSFTQATRSADVSVTPGYVGGSAPATWDLSIPDLTAAGFDPNWGLRPATRTDWGFSTYGGSFLAFIGGIPTEGTTFNFANRTGSFAGALRSFSRQPSTAGRSSLEVTLQRASDRLVRLRQAIVHARR